MLLIQRFIALFAVTLPFALLGQAGAWTPVFVMMVIYPVFMIDTVATELDAPFGHDPNDLPLTRIRAGIQHTSLPGVSGPPALHRLMFQLGNED